MRALLVATIATLIVSVTVHAPTPAAAQAAALKFYESEHYRLGTDIDEQTARDYLQAMEAAWPQMKEFFDGEPKLKKGERLNVYFTATQEGWHEQLKADKVGIPVGAGGYYAPGTKGVYLWKQPTLYTSRQLLLHECMHQFHYLAKCNNVGPKDVWYIEGLVEHLSRHYWDGKTLVLGVVPFCSLENYPQLALELFERKDYDLGAMIDGSRASARPEQWALVRYLVTQGNAKEWRALCKKLDGGQAATNVFKRHFGDAAKLQPKIHEWLKTQHEPFVPIWNEWQGLAADGTLGTAPANYSACRTRDNVTSLAADIVIPAGGQWNGGLLVHFKDTTEYAVFLIDQDGQWVVTRRAKDGWSTPARGNIAEPKPSGRYRLVAERDGAALKLSIDGAEVGKVELPHSPMGVALRNSTLRFEKLEWK